MALQRDSQVWGHLRALPVPARVSQAVVRVERKHCVLPGTEHCRRPRLTAQPTRQLVAAVDWRLTNCACSVRNLHV
jgi:hypothetical protein